MNWSLAIGLVAGFLLTVLADYAREWIDRKRESTAAKLSASRAASRQKLRDEAYNVSHAKDISAGLNHLYTRARSVQLWGIYDTQIGSFLVLSAPILMTNSPYARTLTLVVGFALMFLGAKHMMRGQDIDRVAVELCADWSSKNSASTTTVVGSGGDQLVVMPHTSARTATAR